MMSGLRSFVRQHFTSSSKKEHVRALYDERDYLEAYSRHTDLRVAKNPHEAIGGHWDEMGQLQFRFLVDNGLHPDHDMLDIGCGTLRGGRHFISYLEAGRYTGMDISKSALAYGEMLVTEEGLADKQPTLLLNEEQRLRFGLLSGRRFDVLLAQSVFTHLPKDMIEEAFEHLDGIMKADSLFFFTFYRADDHQRKSLKDFHQPWTFYQDLAERHGYRIEDRAEQYPHPSGQRMVVLSRA